MRNLKAVMGYLVSIILCINTACEQQVNYSKVNLNNIESDSNFLELKCRIELLNDTLDINKNYFTKLKLKITNHNDFTVNLENFYRPETKLLSEKAQKNLNDSAKCYSILFFYSVKDNTLEYIPEKVSDVVRNVDYFPDESEYKGISTSDLDKKNLTLAAHEKLVTVVYFRREDFDTVNLALKYARGKNLFCDLRLFYSMIISNNKKEIKYHGVIQSNRIPVKLAND